MKSKIKIALAGIGNCPSALVQGLGNYRYQHPSETAGFVYSQHGGCRIDATAVAAALLRFIEGSPA